MKKITSILLYLFCISALLAQNGIQSEQKKTIVDSISDPALNRTLVEINNRFEHVDVELVEWPDELKKKLGTLKKIAFLAFPVNKPTGKLPLLISLHGGGGKEMSLAQQLARSAEVKGLGLAELAKNDLILLEPNTAGDWEVSSLNVMLDYVLKNYQEVDENRVYVMGHSMGGRGTWAWINESSNRFAAAAPCGFSAGETGDAKRLVSLPIWGMAGGDDGDRATGIKKMVERLRAAGNKHVKHTEFPGANHAEGNAAVFSSVELVDWMLGFSRGNVQVAVAQESVQIPTKDEVLNTLKEQHPRLISIGRVEEITQVIQENELAKKIWISNLEFAEELFDKKPLIYEKPDGRRLLSVSREALDRIRSLGLCYLILGEKKYAERAWQELEAVASFSDWNPSHFLDCAEMTHAVAVGYDWLYNFWNAEQRKLLEDAILQKGLKPALEVYSREVGWHTGNINWNQVCNGGISIGALAIAEHIPDVASEILSTAIESVLLPMKDYEPDGGGYEGPTYWDYGSRYNVLFMDALDNSLGTDFGLSSMEGFRRSGDFQIHLSGTDLWCFNFSDSDLKRMSTAQHFWMGKKYDEQDYSGFRYMALKRGVEGNLLDLLWFDDRFKDFDLNSMPLDKHFRVAEIITMRDSWDNGKGFAIAMKGGSSTRVHSHMDLGSFMLEYDGVRWFTDFGKDAQTYQRHINKAGRWDFYRTRAEGHNTLVINPEFRGSQKRTEDGIAEFIKFESGKESATAVLDVSKSYYNDALFKRTFSLTRGIEFRIVDEIKCKEPSELFLFYHTEAEIELTKNNRQAILKQDGKSMVVNLLKPLEAKFEVLPAEPMPESPILPFQEKNEGIKKLSIHFIDAEAVDVEITVKAFNGN